MNLEELKLERAIQCAMNRTLTKVLSDNLKRTAELEEVIAKIEQAKSVEKNDEQVSEKPNSGTGGN